MENTLITRITLFLSILILLSGCAPKAGSSPMIRQAVLSEEEQRMADLIQTGRDVKFYDYQMDADISALLFSIESLNDEGQWETLAASTFHQLDKKEGRIAIILSRDSIVFSCEDGQYEVNLDPASFQNTTESWIEETSPIHMNEKIPLGMLIGTDSDSVLFPDISEYYEPDKLLEKNYDDVKVITITLSDLSNTGQSLETAGTHR